MVLRTKNDITEVVVQNAAADLDLCAQQLIQLF